MKYNKKIHGKHWWYILCPYHVNWYYVTFGWIILLDRQGCWSVSFVDGVAF